MSDAPSYFTHHRAEMAAFLPSRYQHVLEVGCGEGRFRANLTHPCEYTGVEPSARAADAARHVLDHVHVGTFDSVAATLPKRHFDLVICNDVIEHMVDHDAFLERIKDYLAEDGVLVGSVPNVRFFVNLWALVVKKDWHYCDEGTLDRTHLRFFTQKSWLSSLAEHGFQVEAFAGIQPLVITGHPLKRAATLALMTIAGRDTRFLQFGFRASVCR